MSSNEGKAVTFQAGMCPAIKFCSPRARNFNDISAGEKTNGPSELSRFLLKSRSTSDENESKIDGGKEVKLQRARESSVRYDSGAKESGSMVFISVPLRSRA
jgi:hypothetical protein